MQITSSSHAAPDQILVTGATGFVGGALARALAARGIAPRLLVRANSDPTNIARIPGERVVGDLTDTASLERAVAGCRQVFHIAADYRIWVPDPAAMLRANIDGSVALVRAAQAAGVERIVYCSSVAALGLTGTDLAADENTPVDESRIVGTYKLSKFRAEQAILTLARQGAPVVIVNPSMPVGPGDVKPTPTGRLIRDAARGKIPAFVNTGMNVVHVDDVAQGHLLAMERGAIGEKYILGGDNLSLRSLLGLIAELSGRRPPKIALPRAPLFPLAALAELFGRLSGHEPMLTLDALRMSRKKMYFSSERARHDLGYAPRPVREAIGDALAWFAQR